MGLPRGLQVAKVQRSEHVRRVLTQSRQGLCVSLDHGRLRTRADRRSSGLRRIGHPLITSLSVALRSSQCDVLAGVKHTRSSRSSFSFTHRSHRVTNRVYRSGNWNKSPVSCQRVRLAQLLDWIASSDIICEFAFIKLLEEQFESATWFLLHLG